MADIRFQTLGERVNSSIGCNSRGKRICQLRVHDCYIRDHSIISKADFNLMLRGENNRILCYLRSCPRRGRDGNKRDWIVFEGPPLANNFKIIK